MLSTVAMILRSDKHSQVLQLKLLTSSSIFLAPCLMLWDCAEPLE